MRIQRFLERLLRQRRFIQGIYRPAFDRPSNTDTGSIPDASQGRVGRCSEGEVVANNNRLHEQVVRSVGFPYVWHVILRKGGGLMRHQLLHKGFRQANDFRRLLVEREMSRIENMDLSSWNVLPISLSAGNDEGGVVPAPNNKHGRLMVAKPFLPNRI